MALLGHNRSPGQSFLDGASEAAAHVDDHRFYSFFVRQLFQVAGDRLLISFLEGLHHPPVDEIGDDGDIGMLLPDAVLIL